MIESFRDDWLRAFFVDDLHSKKVPADLADRLFRKLQLIDDATNENDLRIPPSNHYEKLKGTLAGQHSIRVSGHWRLIFAWSNTRNAASNIYLDSHTYR